MNTQIVMEEEKTWVAEEVDSQAFIGSVTISQCTGSGHLGGS